MGVGGLGTGGVRGRTCATPPGVRTTCLPACLFSDVRFLFSRIKTRSFPRLVSFPQIRQIQNSEATDGKGNQGKRRLGLGGEGHFHKWKLTLESGE